MLRRLIDSFTLRPAVLLGAYESLPLAPEVRIAVAAALLRAVKVRSASSALWARTSSVALRACRGLLEPADAQDAGSSLQASNAQFGLVACGDCLVAVSAQAGQLLEQWDVLLLLNFLRSNESFLHGEAFTPVCLPHYNSTGNLHAYIHYLDAATHTSMVLLAGGVPDFAALSGARSALLCELLESGTLQVRKSGVGVQRGSCTALVGSAALPADSFAVCGVTAGYPSWRHSACIQLHSVCGEFAS